MLNRTEREKIVDDFEAKKVELLKQYEAEAKEAKEKKSFKTSLNTSVSSVNEEGIFYSYLVPTNCILIGFGAMLEGTVPEEFKLIVKRKFEEHIKTDAFVLKSGTNTVKENIPLAQGALLSLTFSSPAPFNVNNFHITLIIESE